jgi:DNA-binding MarR family transcriptional regulator
MATDKPLNETEEELWHSLLQVSLALPRTLEAGLTRSVGLTTTEMQVLVSLSRAPGRRLRMSQLAEVTALSPSRVTRVVAELQKRGFVDKRGSEEDGRGYVTELTTRGRADLKRTYAVRLNKARELVIDRLEPAVVPIVLDSLRRILEGLHHHDGTELLAPTGNRS